MKITPTTDRILILLDRGKTEIKTDAGLFIPVTSAEQESIGKVHSIGPNVFDIAVDDTIVYYARAGVEQKILGSTYLILREADILAKLTK